MNVDDLLHDWLARRRSVAPPSDLTDRILAALPDEPVSACSLAKPSPQRSFLQRLTSALLVAAATMVLVLRIYSAISVITTPVSMDADDGEVQKENHERRLA